MSDSNAPLTMIDEAAVAAAELRRDPYDYTYVEQALPACIAKTAQTIREQYHKATLSPSKGNIYKEVLLAAALVQVDELRYFAPADLQKPLAAMLQREETKVSLFGQHLKSLCEPDRGDIPGQIGTDRKFRYRFVGPMMQPFILVQGLRTGQITRQQVNELAATHYQPRFSNDF